jgi:hypothetical protein
MPKLRKRSDELSTNADVRNELCKVFAEVDQGFEDQNERTDENRDNWDLYNGKLGEKQFYNGNSQIFVPIINNAVEARKTRFVNQIFPQSGRYVEVTTPDAEVPHALMALLEHYVDACRLQTEIIPALMVAGDVEGQYSVYVGWSETTRNVVRRVRKPMESDGLEFPEIGQVEKFEDTVETVGRPTVELIPDADLLVLPATSDSIEAAIAAGGSVTIRRRWSKGALRRMIRDGDITKAKGEALIARVSADDSDRRQDTRRKLAAAAGIRSENGAKYVLGYETWTQLKIDGEMRLCRAYYGGDDEVLGCKLNPYWNDRVPVISGPVNKLPGVFKGRAPVAFTADMQVFANDTINEAADTAHFSAMPIIMTDPEKNPRVGSMILGLASVWETNPNDTQFAQFPELWRHGFDIVAAAKAEIFQTLGVNSSMIPSTSGASKQNQAEVAQEQQVDLLTTAGAVTTVERTILTPLLTWFAELDHQFREDEVVVRAFGEMGLRATMTPVEPIQIGTRYAFRWFGVEAARNAQQIQQQIAMANVFKGVPPAMYPGYRLNLAPLMVQMAENAFGPRLAPLIFEDVSDQNTVDPEVENEMLEHGFDVAVHPADDDPGHMAAHMAALRLGDPHGTIREHIAKHQLQMQAKAQAAMAAAGPPPGLPGAPGGAGPGVAGTPGPAEGGQPEPPRSVMAPPGMIHPDSMAAAGAVTMPRRM